MLSAATVYDDNFIKKVLVTYEPVNSWQDFEKFALLRKLIIFAFTFASVCLVLYCLQKKLFLEYEKPLLNLKLSRLNPNFEATEHADCFLCLYHSLFFPTTVYNQSSKPKLNTQSTIKHTWLRLRYKKWDSCAVKW